MNIPKEVIQDLLPVYLAGEASPATRAWIEQQLVQDLELAGQLRQQMAENIVSAPPPLPPPELELIALRRTRRMMTLLRWLFGLGMAFTAIALALEITFRPFTLRLLLLDNPAQLGPCLAVGVACWVAYFLLRSRLLAK
jgi:predicted anti-sigma-YlaC factor YlaD